MTQASGGRIGDGLRVVELGSSVSAAVAGLVMADAGAEVIQVEPPGGSPLREQPSFAMWARGKQSLVADLSADGGRSRVESLLAQADVALVGLKPTSARRFGFDHASLADRNPGLVHVSISGFGSRGPYADLPWYDGSMQAKAGRMWDFSSLQGGERPAFAAAPVLAHATAMLVLQGVFGALRERLRTGRGQAVETSLVQAYSIHDMLHWWPGAPMTLRLEDVPFVSYSVARTKDGVWVQFAQNGPVLFDAFLRALGLSDLGDYASVMAESSPEELRRLRGAIQKRFAEQTWEEWQQIFEGERNVSAERFWAPGEALSHPQFEAIGDVIELDDSEGAKTRQLGPIVECPSLPLRAGGPAPALDSLGDRGFRCGGDGSVSLGEAPRGEGLLAGVTVLELGMWIALPYAATLLADLGARVIKVEPLTGDPMRGVGGTMAMKMVQGKETLCLDLKDPRATQIVHRLVERSDALLHSYRPGVPERLGIDFETLRSINPRLVHLYNGSYGSRGPMAFAAAFHVTGGAVCGGAVAQAGEGARPPGEQALDADEIARISRRLEVSNEANPDFNSAVAAAAATCMGLYAAARYGEPLALETRMMLSNAYMMSPWFTESAGHPRPALPDADLNGLSPLYRLYPASEGWVFLAAPEPRDFERLCDALGDPELSSSFADAAQRAAKPDVLSATLERVFRSRDADSWERNLTRQGVSCMRADIGPLARWAFDEPWARESGLIAEVQDSEIGAYTRYGACLTTARPAPLGGGFPAGQDTRALLAEIGCSSTEIEKLLEDGVVATPA